MPASKLHPRKVLCTSQQVTSLLRRQIKRTPDAVPHSCTHCRHHAMCTRLYLVRVLG